MKGDILDMDHPFVGKTNDNYYQSEQEAITTPVSQGPKLLSIKSMQGGLNFIERMYEIKILTTKSY